MHEPAGVVENLVQILQNTPILKYSFRMPPSPLKMKIVRDLGTLTFQFQNTPLPPRKLKFRQILALCHFSVSEYPSPPRKLKLRQILALCHFSVSEYPLPLPRKFKFRQIFPMGNYVWQVTTCGDFIQPG